MQDKLFLRIAGVISLVIGIICCITIVGLIVGIPLVIAGNKFKEIAEKPGPDSNEDKQTILIWTIVFAFINHIGFIFSVIYYIQTTTATTFTTSSSSSSSTEEKKYEKLEKLKKLYDEKVLTKEEYEKEKEKILNK